MTFLNLAFPLQSAVPVAEMAVSSVVGAARPLLGMGILATMLVVFKPLITGLLRASLLLISPRLTKDEKVASRNLRNLLAINNVARDLDSTSPSMAAELRALASRG
ncbi:hypothetical protein [Undibacterium terreum]|uniref:Uncharacterized protein n=1 Tax=Undibacterium terreum TaxID=1224302 RepID=A0A916UZ75_9BURK|nr:hypothetical protein [Undibacterium terreum]GGC95248.1 hypothetical protein GCM10011396_48260 [Undibacterium terreum]